MLMLLSIGSRVEIQADPPDCGATWGGEAMTTRSVGSDGGGIRADRCHAILLIFGLPVCRRSLRACPDHS
jgi:hypothetical protein